MSSSAELYHLGFGLSDLPVGTTVALLSGDPSRSERIAGSYLTQGRDLARNRGLDSFLGDLPNGRTVLCATSGMGAPSTSIVVNELVQVGIETIIRIGTCGSIQPSVATGSVIVAAAALTNQGAARDIAPSGYPAAADPYLTVALASGAQGLGVDCRVGVVASTDSFYEGQARSESSANPNLLRRIEGLIDEYVSLGILGFEMEAGVVLTMGGVYGFKAGAVMGVVAARNFAETPDLSAKDAAVDNAIRTAIAAAVSLD